MGKKKDKKAGKKKEKPMVKLERSVQLTYQEIDQDNAIATVKEALDLLDELIQKGFDSVEAQFEPADYGTSTGTYVDYNTKKKCWRVKGQDQMMDDDKVEKFLVDIMTGELVWDYNKRKYVKRGG